jgi:hypothetical protein
MQVRRGLPITEIAAHVGHSLSTLTLDTYAHVASGGVCAATAQSRHGSASPRAAASARPPHKPTRPAASRKSGQCRPLG